MEIILVQIILGIVLFFIINWIGKHSYSIGYMEISIFVDKEEAPALNFLIRVLSPIVYIIIVSTSLYYFGLDKYVINIYFVNVYYIILRLIFNLLTNRGLLLNWYRQTLYWVAIIAISYFTYEKLIKVKTNILPDFTTLSNELWIIIFIFIFQIVNSIRLSDDGKYKRKNKYLKSRYYHFKNIYGNCIKQITKNEILEAITFTILIYEDFNRPKMVRYIENLKFKITQKPHTLGVMQVLTEKKITDKESVILGAKKIVKSHKKYLEHINKNEEDFYEWSAFSAIIGDYNTGSNYGYEVTDLVTTIKEEFYKHTKDSLEPNK